jgi:hypothetical protein
MTDINPKLMKLFSADSLCLPLTQCSKAKIAECMQVIDTVKLVKFVGQLPDKILANINTLVDPQVFSDYLLKYNKDLLRS